jgi:hypothetical protein
LNESAAPVFYPALEITAALNEAQRFFCVLTLGLEVTATWTLTGGQTFYNMLALFPDWIAPLRIMDGLGVKVRPATVADLNSLDPQWISSPGGPSRYMSLGAGFIGLYQQHVGAGFLTVTYARAPVVMVGDGDVPEIPTEYHPCLIQYAIYRLRQVEGGIEFQKALKNFASFLSSAQHYGDYVRTYRNRGSRYDMPPFELRKYDLAALLGEQ